MARKGRKPLQKGAYHYAMDRLERDLLIYYVREADGNLAQAAQLLGIHKKNLYRRIESLGYTASKIRAMAVLEGSEISPRIPTIAAEAEAEAQEPDPDSDPENEPEPDGNESRDPQVIPIRD